MSSQTNKTSNANTILLFILVAVITFGISAYFFAGDTNNAVEPAAGQQEQADDSLSLEFDEDGVSGSIKQTD